MKKILVPTDFSQQAENALKIAAQFARKENFEIVLVHLLELPMQTIDPVGGIRTNEMPEALFFMKLAKKRFSETIAQDYLEGITIHKKVQFNSAFRGIIDTCKEFDCDMIIMGSQGATGFQEMLIGSNTEKVVRNSEVPVLVIKNEHENFKVNNFAFAIDFDAKNKKTLQQAMDFALLLQAKLHLVHINTSGDSEKSEEAERQVRDIVENHGFENYSFEIYRDSSVEKGILNFAKEIDAELIGIATHGRKGLAHFFNGSISEDLVNHAKIPVVTFRL